MMLFYYLYIFKYVCIGALMVSFLVTAFAGYAYYINSQRPPDDPEKKDFHPEALIFVFFTWPILLPAIISVFLLRALLYGVFIVCFSIFLILIPPELREPTWAERKMKKIGDALLEANSFLIKLLLKPWTKGPEPI